MRLRRRKRPALVIPIPIVGGHRFKDWNPPGDLGGDVDPAHFLWGMPTNEPRRGLRLYAPSDAEWAEQYAARKQGRTGGGTSNVSYDPTEATKHLLRVGHLTRVETENHESE